MPVHRDAERDAEQDVRRSSAWILGEEKDRETGEHPGQDRDPARPEGMKRFALGRHGDPMSARRSRARGTSGARRLCMTNQRIAATFEQVAQLLEEQSASPHRVRAWRDGAQGVREHDREMSDVFRDHGRIGLEAIPHIGQRLSAVIIELIKTGRCAALDRLRGHPVRTLERIPGLGRALAERVHRELGIETLEALEVAAHDGRLARVAGFGPRRIAAIRDVLAARLSRTRAQHANEHEPSVGSLLDVDRRYRFAARGGVLPKITPRRFNPDRNAWLPVMHVDREGWSFTALFSNTALAHQLGLTDDWVVLYFHEPHRPDNSATVVTEWRGPSRGRRVVRGRERECEAFYSEPAVELERRAS